MSRRKNKRGRPARDPAVVARTALGKLPGGRGYSLVVPFPRDLNADDCYALATVLAQVAKEYVEAGDAKRDDVRELLDAAAVTP